LGTGLDHHLHPEVLTYLVLGDADLRRENTTVLIGES